MYIQFFINGIIIRSPAAMSSSNPNPLAHQLSYHQSASTHASTTHLSSLPDQPSSAKNLPVAPRPVIARSIQSVRTAVDSVPLRLRQGHDPRQIYHDVQVAIARLAGASGVEYKMRGTVWPRQQRRIGLQAKSTGWTRERGCLGSNRCVRPYGNISIGSRRHEAGGDTARFNQDDFRNCSRDHNPIVAPRLSHSIANLWPHHFPHSHPTAHPNLALVPPTHRLAHHAHIDPRPPQARRSGLSSLVALSHKRFSGPHRAPNSTLNPAACVGRCSRLSRYATERFGSMRQTEPNQASQAARVDFGQ
ncbi:hypothetical protein BCR44DRAFT_1084661 [Catenaria anguillulae PL171]|uniref:Uncharacterized protein n=1 Tax=Catenaria anguillulae PL171 TaxID=765915 RepID=A0A1Y2HNN5_9FUNG|nr:hypothetical protein BCR44DRAFT_1084661 [Catenaria anguillulae PL171]